MNTGHRNHSEKSRLRRRFRDAKNNKKIYGTHKISGNTDSNEFSWRETSSFIIAG